MRYKRRDFLLATAAASLLRPRPLLAKERDEMPLIRKTIPASGETLPVIGLGTNRYGVEIDEKALAPLRLALARFHELGGRLIDTAPQYRNSEMVLGRLIGSLALQGKFFVATKTDRDDIAESHAQMTASQQRLRHSRIDLMQIHNLRNWRAVLPILREWQAEGYVRYIGITTSRESQYEEFERIIRTERLDFAQIDYSLEQRRAAERILPLAADRGVAVIANRSLGGGRLFQAVAKRPLPDWAADFGAGSWAQFLLKYAVGHPAVTLSIPGMRTVQHVDDNIGAARGRLPGAAERARQEAFFDAL